MIYFGDALTILKNLETSSVDSLVTDPPAGVGFMGNDWDNDKGGREQWVAWMASVMQECLRVMKPGAHGLVWAIPRTSHWTATALEDAGFEVRDVITHLFGTGFPKSLDISKAIDKAAGAKREIVGEIKRSGSRLSEYGFAANPSVTSPATSEAKEWQGWGTALKPASEHWILVRKKCSEKTVAANVLKHGCGGINIDGCRIESRFPANLVLDEAAAQMLGDPSRFFYVAKASKSDRSTDNSHPTVKSTKLMEYLITLVTHPNGIVLDPFMGSGSTGVAAKRLGFNFIGIEKEEGYFSISEKRLGSG